MDVVSSASFLPTASASSYFPSATASPTSTAISSPTSSGAPEWNSDPAWKLPSWCEPVIVVLILLGSCLFSRRRNYSIFSSPSTYSPLPTSRSPSSDSLLSSPTLDYDSDSDLPSTSTLKHPPKHRQICGFPLTTPNTSRFSSHWHSRILQKFPFLMEMFYWFVTYLIYRLTHILSQHLFSDAIWDVAQENALRILTFEQHGWFSWLFPLREIDVQEYFMENHQALLTFFNKCYALLHIPLGVYFIGWYYYAAPTHAHFARVRRTVTLCNLLAFAVFTTYPCMPPRLLPKEYGFVDTVRRDDAESVFMEGKFVNHLAAMPSMHFGYAFMIGTTCWYHAGAFRAFGIGYHNPSNRWWKLALCMAGAAYPLAMVVTIVATANHYWMDVIVAGIIAGISLACNRIFMVFVPVEDWLLWCLRLEKPKPNCGLSGARAVGRK